MDLELEIRLETRHYVAIERRPYGRHVVRENARNRPDQRQVTNPPARHD